MLKCKYILQIKYTEAILSNSTSQLLWFEIDKMLIAVLNNKYTVLFIAYNFRNTFVPHLQVNSALHPSGVAKSSTSFG